MAYLENTKKFTAVLNRKHPIGQLLNGVCHATAGLVGKLPKETPEFLDYPNDADGFVAAISRYPFIALEAKNSNQLSTLRKAAAEGGVAHNVFVAAMIGHSAQDQIEKTKSAVAEGLDYMVVVLFGEAATLDPLTKKFSLFKSSAPIEGG